MKPQITKLNESALLSLGMDLPTVKALSNIIRVTGNMTDSETVPEVSIKVDETKEMVALLKAQVIVIQNAISIIESIPAAIPQDESLTQALAIMPVTQMPNQVEYLQTEVRQIAEQLAQITEHFTTEVRQIADQQIVNANLIQELRQGTML